MADKTLLIVAIVAVSTVQGCVYSFAVASAYVWWAVFRGYPYEVFGMFFNGAIGIAGYVLYAGNVPISGRVATVDELLQGQDCAVVSCAEAREYLLEYQLLSSFRFICWYTEFLVSYMYLALFLRYGRVMTLLRYTVHSANVLLSLLTFLLVTYPAFPKHIVLGSASFTPVVAQGLILVWVIMSYWFISQSRLYRVVCARQASATPAAPWSLRQRVAAWVVALFLRIVSRGGLTPRRPSAG